MQAAHVCVTFQNGERPNANELSNKLKLSSLKWLDTGNMTANTESIKAYKQWDCRQEELVVRWCAGQLQMPLQRVPRETLGKKVSLCYHSAVLDWQRVKWNIDQRKHSQHEQTAVVEPGEKKDLGTGKDGTTNYHNGRGWVRVTKKAGHSECGQKRYRIQFEGKIVLSLSKKKNSNISVMSSMTLSITSSQSWGQSFNE